MKNASTGKGGKGGTLSAGSFGTVVVPPRRGKAKQQVEAAIKMELVELRRWKSDHAAIVARLEQERDDLKERIDDIAQLISGNNERLSLLAKKYCAEDGALTADEAARLDMLDAEVERCFPRAVSDGQWSALLEMNQGIIERQEKQLAEEDAELERQGQEIERLNNEKHREWICANDALGKLGDARAEALTLAAQVAKMREALELYRAFHRNGGEMGKGLDRCDEAVRAMLAGSAALALDPTAIERYVQAAIDLADYVSFAPHAADYAKKEWQVTDRYIKAKAAKEGGEKK